MILCTARLAFYLLGLCKISLGEGIPIRDISTPLVAMIANEGLSSESLLLLIMLKLWKPIDEGPISILMKFAITR